MKTKVTEQGVLVPRQFFEGVDEVEIRQEHDAPLILPITGDDPILELGTQPISDDIDDASENHDHYLYGYERDLS